MSSYLEKLRTLDARRVAEQHGRHPPDRLMARRSPSATIRLSRNSRVRITKKLPPGNSNSTVVRITNYEITSPARLQRPQSTNYEITAAAREESGTKYEETPLAVLRHQQSTNYEITSPAYSPQQVTNYEKTLSARPQPERGTNYETTSPVTHQDAEPPCTSSSGPDPQTLPRESQSARKSVSAAVERYVAHRLRALRSLDYEAISSWLRAYGMTWPSGREFWIRVHRMRTWPLVGLPETERGRSRRWLDGVAKELGAYFWDERLAARLERVPGTGGGNSLGAHSIRGEVQVDINEYLGGDHLRREDVPKPILVTVTEVTIKEFDNPPERKAVLHFAETERSLVANKTNLKIAKSVFGTSETNDWKGKKIVVYDDPNIFFAGKQTGGLRLRAPKTAEAPQEDVPF